MPVVFLRTVPAIVSAGVVLAVGAIAIGVRELGPSSLHMSMHILAMNVGGPVLAVLLVTRCRLPALSPAWLWTAALVQLAALWGAHVPSVHNTAVASHVIQAGMHGILLLASLLFWVAVLALPNARRWHAVAALLLSGKLVCFLAILLVFAPRALYGNHMHPSGLPALADQQLAGLLMIAACPLSYLLAAIIITVQLINERFAAPSARTAR
jgi:putative membrane protein